MHGVHHGHCHVFQRTVFLRQNQRIDPLREVGVVDLRFHPAQTCFHAAIHQRHISLEILERLRVVQNFDVVVYGGNKVLCDNIGVGQDHHGRSKAFQSCSVRFGLTEAEEQQRCDHAESADCQSDGQ